jgi:hypothetical protein
MDIQTATIVYNNIVFISQEHKREPVLDNSPANIKTIALKLVRIASIWQYKLKLVAEINLLYNSVGRESDASMEMDCGQLESLKCFSTEVIQYNRRMVRALVMTVYESLGLQSSDTKVLELEQIILNSRELREPEKLKKIGEAEFRLVYDVASRIVFEEVLMSDAVDVQAVLQNLISLSSTPFSIQKIFQKYWENIF